MTNLVNPALLLTLTLGIAITATPMREPADPIVHPKAPTAATEVAASPTGAFTKSLFFIYQNGIGPTKGSRCAMTPTCSEFGRLAFRRHGLASAVLVTFDRIHRCGHDLKYYSAKATSCGVSYEDDPPSH